MSSILKNRVKETSITTGTGTFTLDGAVTNFQTFSGAVGNGNKCSYCIESTSQWEVGFGTVGAGTLTRDTVRESSNFGALVNFSAGTKNVFVTILPDDVRTPKGYVSKTVHKYSSATVLVVGEGVARAADDLTTIELTGDQTVDITAVGSLGLDTKTLTATATTNGTDTFVPSASIVSELNFRTGVGTITTVGTAVTGLSMNDLAVGDLIGSSTTYGWAQVTAWTPPTTPTGTNGVATLSNALPGGNASAIAFSILENATIWPGATAGDKRRIATLSANGLSVVVSGGALTSNAGGETLKTSVEIVSCWYAVFAGTVSSNGRAFLSTNQVPYTFTGLTAYRKIGWVYNDSSGNLQPWSVTGEGPNRQVVWEIDQTAGNTRVLSNSGSTTWADVVCSGVAPRSARAVSFVAQLSGGTATQLTLRRRGINTSANNSTITTVRSITVDQAVTISVPCDEAQVIQVRINSGTTGGYLDTFGYQDNV